MSFLQIVVNILYCLLMALATKGVAKILYKDHKFSIKCFYGSIVAYLLGALYLAIPFAMAVAVVASFKSLKKDVDNVAE